MTISGFGDPCCSIPDIEVGIESVGITAHDLRDWLFEIGTTGDCTADVTFCYESEKRPAFDHGKGAEI